MAQRFRESEGAGMELPVRKGPDIAVGVVMLGIAIVGLGAVFLIVGALS